MSETTLSPAGFLKLLACQTDSAPALYLLTGESGAGKTAWCLELTRQAPAVGLLPVGLVSPAVFEMGVKTSIDLMDVSSGERRRLAVWHSQPADPVGIHPLHWHFDPAALAWGNQLLAELPPSALFLLDELGPLEFHHGGGLSAGLARLDARQDRFSVVVIRPALLEMAQARWHWAQVCTPACSVGEARSI
jgi:hypothetical protein